MKAAGVEVEYFLPFHKNLFERIDDFTHLMISGSEASTRDDMDWTDELTRLIQFSLKRERRFWPFDTGIRFWPERVVGKIEFTNYTFQNIAAPMCYSRSSNFSTTSKILFACSFITMPFNT